MAAAPALRRLISAERAAELVKLLENPTYFRHAVSVPSVPADAKEFRLSCTGSKIRPGST